MEIEDGRPADVQGETAYLTHHFTSTGLVPIIFCAPRNELGDDVPVHFIRHISQKIPDGNAGLARTPLVHDTVGIIVEDLVLKGVEGLVEFEPSMARGESRYEDVRFGAFDRIFLDAGVDGLQDIVGTEAESADIESGIGDETEQMGGVLYCDGGGLLTRSPNLPQKLLSISLAVALRPGFLAMLAMSSRMPSRSW